MAATVKTVTKYVALSYRYNASTHRTTVTRSRRTRVTARFSGRVVQERSRAGTWVQVPYAWSRTKRALVYDHYLHLRLTARQPRTPAPVPAPRETPRGPHQ